MNQTLINIIYCLMGAATMTALIGHAALASRGWLRNVSHTNRSTAKHVYQSVGMLGVFLSLLLNTVTVAISHYPHHEWMMCLELYAVAVWGFFPMQALALMEIKIGLKHWVCYATPFIMAFILILLIGDTRPDVCELVRNVCYGLQFLVYIRTYFQLRRWDKKMHDIYSDVAHKETLWFRRLTICAWVISFWWIPMKYYGGEGAQLIWIAYYITLIILILLFTNHAMQLENLENRELVLELQRAAKVSKAADDDGTEEEIEEQAELPATKAPAWAATLNTLMNDEHLYRESDLDIISLAEKVGVNRTYLSQYFNRSLGCSFYEYINNFRLEESLILLNDFELNIDAVAIRCGFSNQSVFSRTFRKRYDMSPSQWRKSIKRQ